MKSGATIMTATGWKTIAFAIAALHIGVPMALAQTASPQQTSTAKADAKQELDGALKEQQALRDQLRRQEQDRDALEIKNKNENSFSSIAKLQDAKEAVEATENKLEKLA